MAVLLPFPVIFFANYKNIFHKTENQMIILRRWKVLNLNWFKKYDTIIKKRWKRWKKHQTKEAFFTKLQKNGNRNIFVLGHNNGSKEDSDPFSTSKWLSEPQFCESYSCSWQKNDYLEIVIKQPFISRKFWWSVSISKPGFIRLIPVGNLRSMRHLPPLFDLHCFHKFF